MIIQKIASQFIGLLHYNKNGGGWYVIGQTRNEVINKLLAYL